MIKHHGVRPNKILYQGSKIMYMHIAAGLGLTFLDSPNFLQMKLSKIPACFDLTEMKKGYFPHLFNKTENKHYVSSYPKPEYYGVDYMSSKERTEFEKWYPSKKNEVFDFQKELREYCISDVDILRKGCMKFREIMMSVTSTKKINDKGETMEHPGLDPFAQHPPFLHPTLYTFFEFRWPFSGLACYPVREVRLVLFLKE
jgi:hypothetical protein